MPVFISDIAYSLGPVVETVEECASRGRTLSDAALLRESGFGEHRICAADATAYSLAHDAVGRLGASVTNCGAIIYSTCLPCNGNIGKSEDYQRTRDVKHLMDFPASHLQADFDLTGAQVYGLNQQACTGLLGAMHLASLMLKAEPELNKVLCLTADRFPSDAIYEQAYNLISDGAASCIVSADDGMFKLIAHHGVTNGAMSFASDDEVVGTFFNYSYAAIKQTLEKAKLQMSDISWIVPQNTNKKAWKILSSLLGFDWNRVHFPTLDTVAHLISGDNLVNLKSLLDSKQLRSGDKVVLFMAGYGLNWQCLILEYV